MVEGGNGCASSSGSPGAPRDTYRLPTGGVHGIRNPLFFHPQNPGPSSLGANKGWDGLSGEFHENGHPHGMPPGRDRLSEIQ